jgi:hypothetical protein
MDLGSRALRCVSVGPLALVLGTVATLAVGCGESEPATVTTSKLTYWDDVAPLLNEKCAGCHQPGGIGPFSVLTYQDVAPRAASIAAMTRSRLMPPFLITHDGSCGQFEDGAALTQAEIDRLQAWAAGPLVEGSKRTLTVPAVSHLEGGTDYKTPAVVPVAAGTEYARFDDYRCFDVGAKLAKEQFITGYEILPGNPAVVHHVLAFIVDPAKKTRSGKTNAEIMAALDAADPDRVGWSCFGAAGDGVEDDSAPVVWAPGQGAISFPDKIGVRQRPGDRLVIQVHYNLADPMTRGAMDSTTVRLRYADSVERPAAFLVPDGLLESLFIKPPGDELAPGKAAVDYTWTRTMAEMGLAMAPPLDIIAVMPHMHERGRKSELRLLGSGGRNDCVARVENWNFHWQKFYFYKGTRPQLTPDTKVQLTCTFDTSRDQTAIKPGWGTNNEMCLNTLIVALPPGS